MIRSIYGVKKAFTATMAIAMAVVLVSCGDIPPPGVAAVKPLGNFKRGLALAIAKNAEQGPMSRGHSQFAQSAKDNPVFADQVAPARMF